MRHLKPSLRWGFATCLAAGAIACGGASPANKASDPSLSLARQPASPAVATVQTPPTPPPTPSAESMRLDSKIIFPRFIRSNPNATTVIVFIHGFMSSARDAWTHRDGTFLPLVLAQDHRFDPFDIYVSEYPTCAVDVPNVPLGDAQKLLIKDLKDPVVKRYQHIVVVAHSMGGLVTKALVLTDAELARKASSVFFLGTPELGSPKADYAWWVFGRCGDSQVADLRPKSNYLKFSHDDWTKRLDGELRTLPRACLAEGRSYLGLFGRIVPFDSAAALCADGGTREFATDDHTDLPKVSLQDVRSTGDSKFSWLASGILKTISGTNTPAALTVAVTTPEPSWIRTEPKEGEPWHKRQALTLSPGFSSGPAFRSTGFSSGPAFRFEDDLIVTVSEGRLSNIQARCVEACGTAPPGNDVGSPPQNSPSFGQRPRWLGLPSASVPTRGGAGISHWKTDPAPPVWEVTMDYEVRADHTDLVPQVYNVKKGEEIAVRVPATRSSAAGEFSVAGVTHRFTLGEPRPDNTNLELLTLKREANTDVYTYRWNAR